MARSLVPNQVTELTADTLRPCYGVLIDLPNPVNAGITTHAFWTGDYDVSRWMESENSYFDFIGAGNLLSVSEGSETSDLSANGLSISLMATTDIISVLRDKEYQGMPVRAFVGTVRYVQNQRQIAPDFFKFFEGFADQLLFSMNENSVIVTLKAENKLVRLSKSSGRYYTQEDQIAEHPNDKGFEFMNNLQDREVLWGRK